MKIRKQYKNIALIVLAVVAMVFVYQFVTGKPFAVSESTVEAGGTLIESYKSFCSKDTYGAKFDPGATCQNVVFTDVFTCTNGKKITVTQNLGNIPKIGAIEVNKQFSIPLDFGNAECRGTVTVTVNAQTFIIDSGYGDRFSVTATKPQCTEDMKQACYTGGVGTSAYTYITVQACVNGRYVARTESCKPVCDSSSWKCEQWTACGADGFTKRSCTQDTSGCVGTGLGSPVTIAKCTVVDVPIEPPIISPGVEPDITPPICDAGFELTADGCTPVYVPPVVTTPDTPPVVPQPQKTFWDTYGLAIIISVVAGIVAWVVIIIYYSVRRK